MPRLKSLLARFKFRTAGVDVGDVLADVNGRQLLMSVGSGRGKSIGA